LRVALEGLGKFSRCGSGLATSAGTFSCDWQFGALRLSAAKAIMGRT
jgi:hypothetical protein